MPVRSAAIPGLRPAASKAAGDLPQGFNADRDDTARFAPVTVDRVVEEGAELRAGATMLVAHMRPGHTRGCTSWTMRAGQAGRTYAILFAGSLSVAGERLVGTARYPQAAADFEQTFRSLRRLPADVFLGFHASQFDFDAKRRRQLAGDPLALVDSDETRERVDEAERAFRRELAAQQRAAGGH